MTSKMKEVTAQTKAATRVQEMQGDAAVATGDKEVLSAEEAAAAEKQYIAEEEAAFDANKEAAMGHLAVAAAAGAAALVLVDYGKKALDAAKNYQEATTSMQVHSGMSASAATKLANAMLATGGSSTFSANQMMAAFAPVSGEFRKLNGSAISTSSAMQIMSAAEDLAEASGGNLSDTTKTLADVMTTFHLSTQKANSTADALWNTSTRLGVPISEVGQDLERMRARMGVTNMTIQQQLGLMTELSSVLGKGRVAMRMAGRAMQEIIDPSTASQKAMADLGIEVDNSKGQFEGMTKFLGQAKAAFDKMPGGALATADAVKVYRLTQEKANLAAEQAAVKYKLEKAALDGLTAKNSPYVAGLTQQAEALQTSSDGLTAQIDSLNLQANAFTKSTAVTKLFGRQGSVVMSLIEKGPKTYDAYTKAISKSGTAQKAAETMAGTYEGQMKQLSAALDDLKIIIGDGLLPVFTLLLDGFMAIVKPAVTFLDTHRRIAVVIYVVATALSALVAIMFAWRAAQIMQVNLGKMWENTLGSINLKTMKNAIVDTASAVAKNIATAAQWAWNAATSAGIVTMGLYLIAIIAIIAIVVLLVTHWKQVISVAQMVWKHVVSFFESMGKDVSAAIKSLISWIAKNWPLLLAILTGPIGLFVLFFATHFKQISQTVSTIINDIKNFFVQGWDALISDTKGVVDAIVNFFAGLPGRIMKAIGNIGGMVGKVLSNIPGVGGLISGVGSVLGHLAGGGPVQAGGAYLVGENGPELFLPKTAGSVVPNNVLAPKRSGSGIGGGGAGVYIDLRGSQVMTDADLQRFASKLGGLLTRTVFTSAGIRQAGS